jgi:hypothetical protein
LLLEYLHLGAAAGVGLQALKWHRRSLLLMLLRGLQAGYLQAVQVIVDPCGNTLVWREVLPHAVCVGHFANIPSMLAGASVY